MAIRPPERRDRPDRRHSHLGDDLHQRIDEKRKQIDRRRMSRRESDRETQRSVVDDRGASVMAAQPVDMGERSADLLDVHLLDITAQIEALLRGVREVQENVLRVRGALPPVTGHQPAEVVQNRLARMLRDCDALRDAVEETEATADGLTERLRNERRTG